MNYELRKLAAPDIFSMSSILSKIGVGEIKKCFSSDEVKKLVGKDKTTGKDKNEKSDTTAIGIAIALEIGNVILSNLPKCENEIYAFLANLANVTIEDIRKLSMGEFLEMIVAVIQKEEFKDFLGVVSRLFNPEK